MVVSSHWRHFNQLKSISSTVVNPSQWFLRDIQKHNEMIINAKNESRDECIRLDLLVLRFLINVDTCPFSPLQVLGDMLLWQGWKGSKGWNTSQRQLWQLRCNWNWFTGTDSVILLLAGVSAVCGSWSVWHSFESRICSMGRRVCSGEWNHNRLGISLGLRLSSYFFPMAVSEMRNQTLPALDLSEIITWSLVKWCEMIKSHKKKCQFTAGPCKLQACATAVCKEGRLPTQHERVDHLNNLARKKQVISVQMYLSSVFSPQTWRRSKTNSVFYADTVPDPHRDFIPVHVFHLCTG